MRLNRCVAAFHNLTLGETKAILQASVLRQRELISPNILDFVSRILCRRKIVSGFTT
jgi:hypothetical protein